MKTSGIYVIQNVRNGKVYVGSSADIRKRWYTHESHLNCGRHQNKHLQASWKKHGGAAFKFWVAETCSVESLVEREQWWLDMFEPLSPKGYNQNPRAESTRGYKMPPRPPLSDETRARISASLAGKKQTAETKEKRRLAHLGKKRSPEACAAIRRGNQGKNLGRVQSDAEKAKRAASFLATWNAKPPEERARIIEARLSARRRKRAGGT